MSYSLACPDWEDRIRAGRSLIPRVPIDRREYNRAVGIFNKLRLPDVSGNPDLAEAAGDWFRELVGTLLGSTTDSLGQRIVREVFCLTPKKQSKTTYSAALMLTALIMNKRPRGELVMTGPSQEVSSLAFDQAAGMIELDPDGFLQKTMHVQPHLKSITYLRTKAVLKIKTFDNTIVTGAKPVAVLIDELHEISKNSKASRIIGQLRGGMLPNPEAFLMFITTQSDQQPTGAFKAELLKAREIRDGKREGRMLPVLYEFPPSMMSDRSDPPAWQRPENWPMVMPNLGRPFKIPEMVEGFKEAKRTNLEELQRWCSQHLNIEIGVALQSDRWAGADYWEGSIDKTLTLEELLSRSEVVVAGIDGGGLDDLLGLCFIGRERETRRWLAWHRTWVHSSVLKLRQAAAPALEDFRNAGELIIVDDMTEAFAQVAADVKQVEDSGLLAEKGAVGLDPMGVGMIVDALADVEIFGTERIVGVSQGWKLNGAIKTAEVKLANGGLVHGGQAITAWAVGNAKVEPKGNAITITKQTAGTAKIDPLMALFDAVALMSMNPEARASVELFAL